MLARLPVLLIAPRHPWHRLRHHRAAVAVAARPEAPASRHVHRHHLLRLLRHSGPAAHRCLRIHRHRDRGAHPRRRSQRRPAARPGRARDLGQPLAHRACSSSPSSCLADFLSYWQHRAFHTFGRLWKFHAVHHSSMTLDWLSAARVHPFNDALGTAVVATPLLLLGFSATTLGAYLPLLTLYAIALHANVNWSYGPVALRRRQSGLPPLAPLQRARGDRQELRGPAAVWDVIFGTSIFPRDLHATSFGVSGEPLPAASCRSWSTRSAVARQIPSKAPRLELAPAQ